MVAGHVDLHAFVGGLGKAGMLCFFAASRLKRRFDQGDALDVFGVHGIVGIGGALLTGVFVAASLGGSGLAPGVSMLAQIGRQALGVGVCWPMAD